MAADSRTVAAAPLPPKVREYAVESYSSSYYRWVFAAFTLGAVTFLPINLFSVLYAKSLKMDMNVYGNWITVTYLFSLFAAYPLGSLVDRFHSLRIAMAAMLLYAVSVGIGSFTIRGTLSFGVALWVHGILSGTYFTASASMRRRCCRG